MRSVRSRAVRSRTWWSSTRGRASRPACTRAQEVVWSGSRATQQVGRRVGAHRGPRPGRASGSRRFAGSQPGRTGPRQRIPAALRPRERSRIDAIDRSRSTTPTSRRRRSKPRRRSSSLARRRQTSPEAGRRSTSPGPAPPPSARARCPRPSRGRTQAFGLWRRDVLRPRHDRDAVATWHDRQDLRRRRMHRPGRERLRPAEEEPSRRPVPSGLLRDLRLPVVVRHDPGHRLHLLTGADPARLRRGILRSSLQQRPREAAREAR